MFDINRVLFFILPVIACVLFAIWLLKDYFDKRGSDQSRKSSSSDENDNDLLPAKAAAAATNGHRRKRRNPFRHIYANILHGGDENGGEKSGGAENTNSNSMPHVLQRRHSTVFPLQVAKAAKDLLRGRGYKRQMSEVNRDVLPQPPLEFFEPSAIPEVPDEFKPMFYIHYNVKLLELPSSWILNPKEIDVLDFEANEYIVRPGDKDDAMFVVLEGALAVYISLPEGKECLVKRIEQGYSFFSLLSLIDILMRVPSTLKTVSLKATQRTRVARYSFRRFQEAYEREPAIWVRPIQIIITRLLHVTLTPLHQHLGLGEELFKRRLDDRIAIDDRNRNFSGQSFKLTSKFRSVRQKRLSSGESTTGELIITAIRWYSEALRISYADAQALLGDRVQIVSVEEGEVIVEQGTDSNLSLILVISGALQISQDSDADEAEGDETSWSTFIYPKEMTGGLELLSNELAFFALKAAGPSKLAYVSKVNFDAMVEEMPAIVLPVSYSVVRRVSPFVRAVDFAIDWILTDSGQAVYRHGDLADSVYVVLSGRLRSVSKKTVIEEYGRDDVMGILEMLQRQPRATTVLAVRFSQLARVPEGVLNFVKMQFPQVGFRLVRLLGQYYNENRRGSMFQQTATLNDPISTTKNLRTIAIFPVALDVPIISFACELYHSLNASVKVLRLSSKKVAENLGESVLEKQADFRLMKWLNAQEDNFQLIIYECDYTATNWTRRCLRQADAIFVVANGDIDPPDQQFIDEYLKMNQDGIRTRKELILLWKEDVESPRGTYNWLKGSWFSGHYHIRAPNRMYQWQPKIDKVEDEILQYYEENVFFGKADFYNDFSRLGRILTGNAVGLVLGGGGARGAAHVGIIKALREHGIPVDIVGGTSIGSMVGAIFADEPRSIENLKSRAKSWFMTMSSLWRKLWDLTYAHSAMFTGAGFNKSIQDTFGEKYLEDMWLPYFCITTDISISEMRVHRAGPIWAYTRASMSLAGYLPPLCDPLDGHLLLDGGYVNNLPADVMRSLGAKSVIAVDVGAAPETELFNYGDSLSGFWVLLRRLNPWAEPLRILGMEEIQSRLAFVSCVRQLELVKKAPYCHYLRPPIDIYRTLDFAKFDEICEIGYAYGSEKLSELVKSNTNIKSVMNPEKLRTLTRMKSIRGREGSRSMHNSFTDLAAQISRIPIRHHGGSLRSLNDISTSGGDDGNDSSDWYDDEEEEAMAAIAVATGYRPPDLENSDGCRSQLLLAPDSDGGRRSRGRRDEFRRPSEAVTEIASDELVDTNDTYFQNGDDSAGESSRTSDVDGNSEDESDETRIATPRPREI